MTRVRPQRHRIRLASEVYARVGAICSVTFVGQFKNLSQRAAWGLGIRGAFWQGSFWDHFLRREEQVETAVNYVLNNPVRSGLVQQWQDYPFCGSLVFDLTEQDGGGQAPALLFSRPKKCYPG